jgi:hypothetical protein
LRKTGLNRAIRQAGMVSKGAAFISFGRWIVSLLTCRGGSGSITGLTSTAARFFLPVLWLRLACNTFPPNVCSCLERLAASAIALVELSRLDPGGIDLLDPSAWIVMRELVPDMSQFGRSGIMPVPQMRGHRDHRLRFDEGHRRTNAAAG